MSIVEFIDRGVPGCRPEDSLERAAERILLSGCDSLPVCDDAGCVVGSVSCRAICRSAYLSGRPLCELVVGEAEAGTALVVEASQSRKEVVSRMVIGAEWQAAVVDDDRRFLGVVRYESLCDNVSNCWGDRLLLIDSLERLDRLALPPHTGIWLFLTAMSELISPQGERIPLSRGEAKLLAALVRDSGRVVSREALLKRTCNRSYEPGDRYIDVLIASLRRKFGEQGCNARTIRTIHGGGYALTLNVSDLCDHRPSGRHNETRDDDATESAVSASPVRPCRQTAVRAPSGAHRGNPATTQPARA